MEVLSSILIIAALFFCVIALFKIISAPIKLIFKLLLNAIFGFVILFVVNFVGGFFNFYLTFSWINALVIGFLGIPGVALLIVIQLLL